MVSPEQSEKATVIPVTHVSWQLELRRPIQIGASLTFENIENLLKPELFNLWKDYVSKRDRENLAGAKFGLIHRFRSAFHHGREEAVSDDLAFKVFLCLRLIKPTRSYFQRIQVKFLESGRVEIFSFQHPSLPPYVPDAESLNTVDTRDIWRLRELLPAFLALAEKGPENVRRAVRHFNIGYTELHDPTVQLVLWTMGIESLFTTEELPLSREQLIARMGEVIGLHTDIYGGSPMREYIGDETFTVGDLVDDLLTLRDRFVHGQWIPVEWKDKKRRRTISGESSTYAEMLREASSFILRNGILRHLEQGSKSF
jgi:hypothetical protein